MPVGPVILNSTPLIALFQIGGLELLHQLFDVVVIPAAVWDEFTAIDTQNRLDALTNRPWIQRQLLLRPEQALVFIGLGQGEAETLALALEQQARLVVIDERRGRKYAQRLGLPITGTLGLLLLAKEAGLIERVAPVIESLQSGGLFLDEALIATALAMSGE